MGGDHHYVGDVLVHRVNGVGGAFIMSHMKNSTAVEANVNVWALPYLALSSVRPRSLGNLAHLREQLFSTF